MLPTPDIPPLVVQRRDGGRWGALAQAVMVGSTLALFLLTFAGRWLYAPPAWLTVVVTLLPYLYVTGLLLGFSVWSVIPDRRGTPLALVALLVVGGGLWGPSWPARGAVVPGDRVKVMSWNLQRLWGGDRQGETALECVERTIGAASPDVLTLLEVSREDIDALSVSLGLRCTHATYRGSQSARHGGLATCTRGERWALRGGDAQRFVDGDDWTYVFAEVEHGGRLFNVAAVHLYPYEMANRRLRAGVEDLAHGDAAPLLTLSRVGKGIVKGQSDQSAALLERVRRLHDPTVVAGDFNSTRDAALHWSLREHLVDTWERGGFGFGGTVRLADVLPLRVDYIYATQDFQVVQSVVPKVDCSDHRPVVSELVLRAVSPR